MAEINVSIKGLREVRQELKTLQFELSQATDPEQMAVLSQRAGELRDNLARANEQAAVFSAGSPFEQTSNALGLMNSQLMSLDFEGAAESAKLFATAAKGISPQLIATQLKSLGSVIGQVTKAFISMGASLLANPIFLIGAAIAALVAVIGVLLDKLGFLQPILDAIGEVFEAMKWAIDKAVESIKAFLDWLGLTNFAAQDFASQQQDAMQKVIDRSKELETTIGERYDHETRLSRIAGKDTTEAEIEKQKALIATANIRLKAIDELIRQNAISKRFNEEEIEQLRTLRKEAEKTISDSNKEIEAINAQRDADAEKNRQNEIAKNKAAYKQMLADRKKYEQDRLNISRQIIDLQNELLEDGIQKELTLNKEKYARLIQDTLNNEILLDNERTALVNLLKEQEFENTKAIELRYAEELANALKEADLARKAKEEEEAANRAAFEEEQRQLFLENQRAFAEKQIEAEQALFDAKFGFARGLVGAIGELAGENEKAQNAIFAIDKAMAIAEVIISTNREIAGYFAAYSLIPGGAAIAATQASAAKIRAAISIASIVATSIAKFKGGGGGGSGSIPSGGGGGSASVAASQQTPSFQLFGQNNNANNLTQSQSAESQSQNITVQAVVSETEVTSVQKKVQQMQNNAEL